MRRKVAFLYFSDTDFLSAGMDNWRARIAHCGGGEDLRWELSDAFCRAAVSAAVAFGVCLLAGITAKSEKKEDGGGSGSGIFGSSACDRGGVVCDGRASRCLQPDSWQECFSFLWQVIFGLYGKESETGNRERQVMFHRDDPHGMKVDIRAMILTGTS